MTTLAYGVEYAPDAKHSCSHVDCGKPVKNKELRMFKKYPKQLFKGVIDYYHPQCLFDTFERVGKTTKVIENDSEIEGFGKIKIDDQEYLKKLIREHHGPRPEKKSHHGKASHVEKGKEEEHELKGHKRATSRTTKGRPGKAAEAQKDEIEQGEIEETKKAKAKQTAPRGASRAKRGNSAAASKAKASQAKPRHIQRQRGQKKQANPKVKTQVHSGRVTKPRAARSKAAANKETEGALNRAKARSDKGQATYSKRRSARA